MEPLRKPSRIIRHRRPIEFHQVCAIARMVLLRQPSVDYVEWKESTKDAIGRQGYDEPESELLARAMNQVEHAVKQTMGPRPVALPVAAPEPEKPQQHDPPWAAGYESPGWAIVRGLMRKMAAQQAAEQPAPAAVLSVPEFDLLNQFYRDVNVEHADRVATLKAYAEVAIERPEGWDFGAVRAASAEHALCANQCFGCLSADRSLSWHHIIQIQHGGSNTPRNRAALCGSCHSDIHTWLPAKLRANKGWMHVGTMAASIKAGR